VNLIQNDQRFNHGYIIKKFQIAFDHLSDSGSGNRDGYAALATHPDALTDPDVSTAVWWNFPDRRQVAWTSTEVIGDSVTAQRYELIDPTHIVVRDLWIGITTFSATGTIEMNYFIELEEVSLTDNQAVLAIVQEEAQDVN
jgi:hypothetical protein